MNTLRHIDHLLRTWIVTHRVHQLDDVMWMLSVVGRAGMIWLTIGAAAAWRRREWNGFVTLVLALVLAWLSADYLLKPVFGRARPFSSDLVIVVIGGKPGDPSFPSGHAASSFAAARVLTTTAPEGWIAWWALALAISYSRIYLGVHYPFDVLGGAIVGLLSAAIILARRRRVRR
jgi:undecaprenyl-diphosphatase